MANEISMACSLAATKGVATINSGSQSKSANMTGNNMIEQTQVIGTADTVLDLGAIAGTARAVMVKNMDANNFIDIGHIAGVGNALIHLQPGDPALFSPSVANVHCVANVANCSIWMAAVEA